MASWRRQVPPTLLVLASFCTKPGRKQVPSPVSPSLFLSFLTSFLQPAHCLTPSLCVTWGHREDPKALSDLSPWSPA